jgi:hypothetical protein
MNFFEKRQQIQSRLAELAQAHNEAQDIVTRTRAESAFLQGQLALLDEIDPPKNDNDRQANQTNADS